MVLSDVFDSYYRDKEKIHYDLNYYSIHPFYSYHNELIPAAKTSNLDYEHYKQISDHENAPLYSTENLKDKIKNFKNKFFNKTDESSNKNDYKIKKINLKDKKKEKDNDYYKKEFEYFNEDDRKYLTQYYLNRSIKISELISLTEHLSNLKKIKSELDKKLKVSNNKNEKEINLSKLNTKNKNGNEKCDENDCRINIKIIKEYINVCKNDKSIKTEKDQ